MAKTTHTNDIAYLLSTVICNDHTHRLNKKYYTEHKTPKYYDVHGINFSLIYIYYEKSNLLPFLNSKPCKKRT